jgi:NCS2 family nucleobase:cation symporter-2
VLAETTGTWLAVGAVIDRPISDAQFNRGALGEGLSCLAAALLGSTPMTGYSSNAGIIAMTGVASRAAFLAAGILLVLFGLIGKLSAAIASIPGPVIGGVFAVLCAVIAMNGFRVIRKEALNERNMLVVGLPILFALFATLAPSDWVKSLPQFAQYFLGSSIAFGAIAAMILNLVLPREAD